MTQHPLMKGRRMLPKEEFRKYQNKRRARKVAEGWQYLNVLLPRDLVAGIKEMIRKHKKDHFDVWFPRK
jgi:hypothetical protein